MSHLTIGSELMENPYADHWRALRARRTPPNFLREIRVFPVHEIGWEIMCGNLEIADMLYAGDVLLVRGAFNRESCQLFVDRLWEWGQKSQSSFHKILDGIPDFHRIIDGTVSSAYAAKTIRHAYYFFRHNGDPLGLFPRVDPRWRLFKRLSGLTDSEIDQSAKRLPRDGILDRLMFYRYPHGGGELKTHIDPVNNQPLVIGGFLSTRGVDFKEGGIYYIGRDGQKVDLEAQVMAGDIMLAYPSLPHGVDCIDRGVPIDWNTSKGRWFVGMAIVDSDTKARRETTVTL